MKDQTTPDELRIEGFYNGPGGLKCSEDDWDGFRAILQEHKKREGVKDEVLDADRESLPHANDSNDAIRVVEIDVEEIWCLQQHISKRFRDGRRIEILVHDLQRSLKEPTADDSLLLNVARINMIEHRPRKRRVRYQRSPSIPQAMAKILQAETHAIA